jgi:hypothetical protein
MKKNASVFETIKLNKKLMPRIKLNHSNWGFCTEFYSNEFFFEFLDIE